MYFLVTQKFLDRDPSEELLKAFRLFDDDDTGKISLKNLRRVARELVRNKNFYFPDLSVFTLSFIYIIFFLLFVELFCSCCREKICRMMNCRR